MKIELDVLLLSLSIAIGGFVSGWLVGQLLIKGGIF